MKDANMNIFKFSFIGLVCVCVIILIGKSYAEDKTAERVSTVAESDLLIAQRTYNIGDKISEKSASESDKKLDDDQPSEIKTDANIINQSNPPNASDSETHKDPTNTSVTPEANQETINSSSDKSSLETLPVEKDQDLEESIKEPSDESSHKNGLLTFNFDNAELVEVIRSIADLLQINYIIDPKVGGKVTIHTAGDLDRKELFPIFYQILEINGLTAIQQDNFYKIMPAKDAMRMPISSRSDQEGKKADPGKEIIIQIIPLNSISVDEMGKILTPFVSTDGAIVSHVDSNTLMVIDRADNIAKVLRLVATFDTNVFDRVNYRFYPIQYGDVASLTDTMNQMVVAYGSALKTNIAFIPIERLNTLLVVSSNPKAFDELSDFIKNYDVPSQNVEPTIYVYPVKNGQAADIADLMNDIFVGKKEAKKDKKKVSSSDRNPLGKNTKMEKSSCFSTTLSSKSATRSAGSPSNQPVRRACGSPTGRGATSSPSAKASS